MVSNNTFIRVYDAAVAGLALLGGRGCFRTLEVPQQPMKGPGHDKQKLPDTVGGQCSGQGRSTGDPRQHHASDRYNGKTTLVRPFTCWILHQQPPCGASDLGEGTSGFTAVKDGELAGCFGARDWWRLRSKARSQNVGLAEFAWCSEEIWLARSSASVHGPDSGYTGPGKTSRRVSTLPIMLLAKSAVTARRCHAAIAAIGLQVASHMIALVAFAISHPRFGGFEVRGDKFGNLVRQITIHHSTRTGELSGALGQQIEGLLHGCHVYALPVARRSLPPRRSATSRRCFWRRGTVVRTCFMGLAAVSAVTRSMASAAWCCRACAAKTRSAMRAGN